MEPEDEIQLSRHLVDGEDIAKFLAEVDAIGAPEEGAPASTVPVPSKQIDPTLKALLVANVVELKADAYANGWTMQGWRAIDAHRAANAEAYNQKRRDEYRDEVFDKTGKLPRRNRKSPTAKQRADDVAAAQQRRRDGMTTDQRQSENEKRAARRRLQKEREKTEAAAAVAAAQPEHFGKF